VVEREVVFLGGEGRSWNGCELREREGGDECKHKRENGQMGKEKQTVVTFLYLVTNKKKTF